MSNRTLGMKIELELLKLNTQIDMKIIKGLPYKNEARRHKFLTKQLRELQSVTSSWLAESLSFIGSFVL